MTRRIYTNPTSYKTDEANNSSTKQVHVRQPMRRSPSPSRNMNRSNSPLSSNVVQTIPVFSSSASSSPKIRVRPTSNGNHTNTKSFQQYPLGRTTEVGGSNSVRHSSYEVYSTKPIIIDQDLRRQSHHNIIFDPIDDDDEDHQNSLENEEDNILSISYTSEFDNVYNDNNIAGSPIQFKIPSKSTSVKSNVNHNQLVRPATTNTMDRFHQTVQHGISNDHGDKEEAEASWEALMRTDEGNNAPGQPQRSIATRTTVSSSTFHQQPYRLGASTSGLGTNGASMSTVGGGGRIARLAAMFTSSRATISLDPDGSNTNASSSKKASVAPSPVSNYQRREGQVAHSARTSSVNHQGIVNGAGTSSGGQSVAVLRSHPKLNFHNPPSPVSPVHSSGSSAYVGWPGTQDKRGHTVVVHNSYEDSSDGGGGEGVIEQTFDQGVRIDKVSSPYHQYALQSNRTKSIEQEGNYKRSFVLKSSSPSSVLMDDLPRNEERTKSLVTTANPSSAAARRLLRHQTHHIPSQHQTSHDAEEVEKTEDIVDFDDEQFDTMLPDINHANSLQLHHPVAINRKTYSALQYAQSDVGGHGRKLSFELKEEQQRPELSSESKDRVHHGQGWDDDPSERHPPNATESSKFASSYLQSKLRKTTSYGDLDHPFIRTTPDMGTPPIHDNQTENQRSVKFHRYGDDVKDQLHAVIRRSAAAAGIVSQPPTIDNLMQNEQFVGPPPHRTYTNAEGYRGLLDKTKDVPCLVDNMDSDSMSSSKATSVHSSVVAGGGNTPSNLNQFKANKQPHQRYQVQLQQPSYPLHNQARDKVSMRRQFNNKVPQQQQQKTAMVEANNRDFNPKYNVKVSPASILRNKHEYRVPVDVDDDAESDIFDGIQTTQESDVFDNLPASHRRSHSRTQQLKKSSYPASIAEDEGPNTKKKNNLNSKYSNSKDPSSHDNNFKLVVLSGGITTIQTTDVDYSNRRTASDFDDQLTNSEVSANGYTRIPGFHEMINSGTKQDSSLHGINGNFGRRPRNTSYAARSLVLDDITNVSAGESEEDDTSTSQAEEYPYYDLSGYYIQPSEMKKVLNKYREMSELFDSDMTLEQFENEADEHKGFAMFEMRSRIMEKDMERGLERRGGTVVVDDLVMTTYNRSAQRIRDTIIVCKAWRDGASIQDVVKAATLGRRMERTYYIHRCGIHRGSVSNEHNSVLFSGADERYDYWEPVNWLDDTDFMQYRCPSLGSRHMRGFEMFTIGDCQSILLKLTNERCMELRNELNLATARQIEAEEMMKDESDNFLGEMSAAEITYLAAMEEVKLVSKQLVQAEQSFTLVRDRIQKLISKYESILMKLETTSSIVTYESSFYSDNDSEHWEQIEARERELWERRAKRAEIRAEIAAREAFVAKQETRQVHEQKEREVATLKQKLIEYQSESSSPSGNILGRATSEKLVKNLALRRDQVNQSGTTATAKTVQDSKNRINNEKIQDVKQRFRERMALRKSISSKASMEEDTSSYAPKNTITNTEKELFRSAEEEMFQQMDFYERSLNAVARTRL